MKTKAIEEAAREYVKSGLAEFETGEFYTDEDAENTFIAGDAHGYARAIENVQAYKDLEEKLKVAVDALEEYDTTVYDGHDYTAKDISHYAKEAIKKIRGES